MFFDDIFHHIFNRLLQNQYYVLLDFKMKTLWLLLDIRYNIYAKLVSMQRTIFYCTFVFCVRQMLEGFRLYLGTELIFYRIQIREQRMRLIQASLYATNVENKSQPHTLCMNVLSK